MLRSLALALFGLLCAIISAVVAHCVDCVLELTEIVRTAAGIAVSAWWDFWWHWRFDDER